MYHNFISDGHRLFPFLSAAIDTQVQVVSPHTDFRSQNNEEYLLLHVPVQSELSGFNVTFSNDMRWSSYHVCTCHLYGLFRELLIRIACPFYVGLSVVYHWGLFVGFWRSGLTLRFNCIWTQYSHLRLPSECWNKRHVLLCCHSLILNGSFHSVDKSL